jgi:hypothetical protein
MKKTVMVLTGFIAMIIVSFSFTNAGPPRYKNLKILSKNTTKEQMDSIMKHFAASLGVKCGFCHVFNQEQKSMDFASDDKKNKQVARSMMRMANKINRKYFKEDNDRKGDNNLQAITCFSCHHGHEHPENKPVMQQGGRPPMSGQQEGQPNMSGQQPSQDKQPQPNQQ